MCGGYVYRAEHTFDRYRTCTLSACVWDTDPMQDTPRDLPLSVKSLLPLLVCHLGHAARLMGTGPPFKAPLNQNWYKSLTSAILAWNV